MTDKAFVISGNVKSANLLTSDDPGVWTGLGFGNVEELALYSRVAAVYRAFNLKANTVGNMPFALYRGKREYDSSATWENKVGFMPNPSELFRLDTLSYIVSNTIYNLMTSDALGYKPRGLYNATPYSFAPWTNGQATALEYIERRVGVTAEQYNPDGTPRTSNIPGATRLIYMWRMDQTTELLPSPNTEAKAILSAAGEIYYADLWIKHFYQSGGIKPTLVAMKGLVDRDSKEEKEKSWWDWLRGLGKYTHKKVKIYNAESLDVQAFGSGVDDLKDNEVYKQALANIAMGTGMPLSLLMANSANYATAKEEKATWYENDIIPLCNWLAYEYNRQVFQPLGLRLEFHPETLDPQQEDETQRATAMVQYAAVLEKVQTAELFFGLASMMGLEVPDDLRVAVETYYKDKEKRAEEVQNQMGQGGNPDEQPETTTEVVIDRDGKPQTVQQQAEPEEEELDEEEEEEDEPAPPPAKWIPSLDELEEMRVWREVALRRHKKGESLDFVYEPHHGGLPADYTEQVKAKLIAAQSAEDVKSAFVVVETVTPAPEYKSDVTADPAIMALAESINKLAEAYKESGK